jgi:hypothetical protein
VHLQRVRWRERGCVVCSSCVVDVGSDDLTLLPHTSLKSCATEEKLVSTPDPILNPFDLRCQQHRQHHSLVLGCL